MAAVVAVVVATRDSARTVSPRPRTFWVQVGRRLLDWLLVGTRDQCSRETEGSIAWLRKAKAPVKRRGQSLWDTKGQSSRETEGPIAHWAGYANCLCYLLWLTVKDVANLA